MSKEDANGVTAADNAKLEHIRGKSLQVALYGLPTNLNKKQLHKFLTHEMKLRKIDVELLTEDGLIAKYPWGRSMIITASAKKDVPLIVKKFDGMTIKMLEKAIIEMENRIDSGGKPFQAQSENQFIKCRAVANVDTANLDRRKQFCRVIIRNLSFQAQFEHIAKKMVKFGPIVDITLPVATSTSAASSSKTASSAGDMSTATEGVSESVDASKRGGNVKHRGFAFVTFLCQADAEAVIAQQSGQAPAVDGQGRKAQVSTVQICNREVAIDFCDHKSGFERKKMLKTLSEEAEEAADKALDNAENSENADVLHEGNIAAESGDEEEQEQEEGKEDSDADSDADDMSIDAEEEDEEEEEEEGGGRALTAKEEEENARDLDDAQEGRTVFIRDLSLDISRGELWRAMHLLMPGSTIVSAFIVKDKITGLGKGSAFVKFGTQEEAQKCVDLHSTCTISDRTCRIDLALDRSGVEKVLEEQKNQVRDKRHVYLLSEGLVVEAPTAGDAGAEADTLVDGKGKKKNKGKKEKDDGTVGITGFRPDPQWAATMSADDKEKRQRATVEKKKKLVNPLFFVSPVRLSLRNLHKDLDDRGLRSMLLKATKEGLQKKLVSSHDMELLLTANMQRINSNPGSIHNNVTIPVIVQAPKESKGVSTAPIPIGSMSSKDVIVSVKVMCDADKLDKDTQQPMSKGYGFVEFKHHGHALAALRALNNNPAYSYNCVGAKELDVSSSSSKTGAGGDNDAGHAPKRGHSKNRPIVEFAIENLRKVQILERRKELNKKAKEDGSAVAQSLSATAAAAVASTTTAGKKRKATTTGESNEVEEDGTTYIRPPTPANAKKSKKVLAAEAEAEAAAGDKENKKEKTSGAVNKQLKRKERKLKRKQQKQEKIMAKSTSTATTTTSSTNNNKDQVKEKLKDSSSSKTQNKAKGKDKKEESKDAGTTATTTTTKSNSSTTLKRKKSEDNASSGVENVAPVVAPKEEKMSNKKRLRAQKK